MNRQSGVIKWFDQLKGYGFIRPDETTDPDRFVHISGWNEAAKPEQGQRVEFNVEQGKKGLEARNVTLSRQGEPAA